MLSENQVNEIVKKNHSKIVEIRRYIHENPELSFQEYNTSKYICSILNELGIEYQSGIVTTGIVGLIKGKNPTKKVIAIRADIDALPIQEENTVDYKSKNNGVMHACGHDMHTSCLIGVIQVLNEMKDKFEGTVKFIFQPGEEKLPGGASLMIKEGVLENPKPDKIFGLHAFPDLEVGKVGFRPGKYMASTDEIYVTVHGKGGHAALPQKNVDPVLITAQILTALQQVISRNAHPVTPSVLSFGKINSNGGATNVIPDKVFLEGTFRTFDENWRTEAHEKIKKIAKGIAESLGGSCDVDIRKGYPFLVNDIETTKKAIESAKSYLDEENVIELDLRMTAEDFAYFSQKIPACFFRVGTRNTEKGITSGLHTSTFNIDEQALEVGVGVMSWLVLKEFENI